MLFINLQKRGKLNSIPPVPPLLRGRMPAIGACAASGDRGQDLESPDAGRRHPAGSQRRGDGRVPAISGGPLMHICAAQQHVAPNKRRWRRRVGQVREKLLKGGTEGESDARLATFVVLKEKRVLRRTVFSIRLCRLTTYGRFSEKAKLRGAGRIRGRGPRWRYQEPPRNAQSATLCAFGVPNNGKMGNSQCHGMTPIRPCELFVRTAFGAGL